MNRSALRARSHYNFALASALIGAMVVGTAAVPASSAEDEKPKLARYFRREKDKFVLESQITEKRTQDGMTYVSLTDRGTEKMTLTLRFDKDHRLTSGEAVQKTAKGKRRADLTLDDTTALLKRGKSVTEIKNLANPIVTTAPDWSDIFQLVRRYDPKKAGPQEFTGLWIHPVREHLVLRFRIERVGEDTIHANGSKIALDRYRIRLRSGDYLTWADTERRVYKLFPAGHPESAVILEGFEEPTKKLGP